MYCPGRELLPNPLGRSALMTIEPWCKCSSVQINADHHLQTIGALLISRQSSTVLEHVSCGCRILEAAGATIPCGNDASTAKDIARYALERQYKGRTFLET